MTPTKFDYIKVSSVNEAVELLDKHGLDAKILSGGHSLIPTMKLKQDKPSVLVDISGIANMGTIKEEAGEIVIGANCTHDQILKSHLVNNKVNILAQTAKVIGDTQVRHRGTIGGSLAHADPGADYPATILACDARVVVVGKNGYRTIVATDFFLGIFTTALQGGEIITSIRFPLTENGIYRKFYQSASRFAVVGVAVVKEGNAVKIGITGVAETPYRASAAEAAYTGNSDVASLAVEGIEVISDHFADAAYRTHLAKTFVKRGLDTVE